jgi:hypothetical protein
MDLTPLEIEMLEKGYVSARMLAGRLGLHVSTINRLVRLEKIPSIPAGVRRFNHGDGETAVQRFIMIASAVAYYGPELSKRFKLVDWSPDGAKAK